jgi:hypothetical protein
VRSFGDQLSEMGEMTLRSPGANQVERRPVQAND